MVLLARAKHVRAIVGALLHRLFDMLLMVTDLWRLVLGLSIIALVVLFPRGSQERPSLCCVGTSMTLPPNQVGPHHDCGHPASGGFDQIQSLFDAIEAPIHAVGALRETRVMARLGRGQLSDLKFQRGQPMPDIAHVLQHRSILESRRAGRSTRGSRLSLMGHATTSREQRDKHRRSGVIWLVARGRRLDASWRVLRYRVNASSVPRGACERLRTLDRAMIA